MSLIVQKYGGTSLADVEKICAVAEHTKKCKNADTQIIVVVSARKGETDRIINSINKISKSPDRREFDQALHAVEIESAGLLAIALIDIGVPAISLSAHQIGLTTTNEHGKARMKKILKKDKILTEAKTKVVVIAGCQGIASKSQDITTPGRGGSDATAVAIAAELNADLCEIYTDVDGVYTADPRIVKDALRFDEISYTQMIAMGNFGAKVMMSRSIKIAKDHGVVVKVLKSPSIGPSSGGTIITEADKPKTIERINALSTVGLGITPVAAINIINIPNKPGLAERIYGVLENILLIDHVQTGVGEIKANMTIYVKQEDMERAVENLKQLKIKDVIINAHDNFVAITLIDEDMVDQTGYMSRISRVLAEHEINIDGNISADKAIGIIVHEKVYKKATIEIAKEFNLTT